MKRVLRQAWQSSFSALPFRFVKSLAAHGVLAPCYHLVSDRPPIHVQHLYQCRNTAEFRAEIDLLLRHFKPLSLSELAPAIRENGHPPDRSLFLSFDDGVREVSEQIAPICLAKGVPATFFLTTGFLDNRKLFYRHKASILAHRCDELGLERASAALRQVEGWNGFDDPKGAFLSVAYRQTGVLDRCAEALEVDFEAYLRDERPYLTSAQVDKLLKDGFEIGGHSVDHPLYTDLSLDEQLAQTRECMAEISNRFHPAFKSFAFPFVSDGVGSEFYQTILGEGTTDLVFCLGGKPEGGRGRTVERFGVESSTSNPLTSLLREQASRKSLARLRRWRKATLSESPPACTES